MGRYDDLMSLCLRRGFLMPAAEIYGGLAGFYDYGHYGARLRRNWEQLWLDYFLTLGDNYHLIDTTTILPFAALKASGHVDLFTDVMVMCQKCREAYKAEALLEEATGRVREGLTTAQVDEIVKAEGVRCPKDDGLLGPAYNFHLMFPLGTGPRGEDQAFLRPETAQGVYLNFKREFDALRKRLPMGLAIVGRAFRNEISPRQGLYRLREFVQAELQIFFDPATFDSEVPHRAAAEEEVRILWEGDRGGALEASGVRLGSLVEDHGIPPWYAYHLAKVQTFYTNVLGIPQSKLRFYEVGARERAHYNRLQFDVQLNIESYGGYREVAGVHYRTDYDLKGHGTRSGEKMEVLIGQRRVVPHVLELSFGVDRNFWALLDHGYEAGVRKVLHLAPRLAPVIAGVFPLVGKDGLPERSRRVAETLRPELLAAYDEAGSIGRRYARMDEVGTPYCVTIDYETLQGRGVTLRDRDTMAQARVAEGDLRATLQGLVRGSVDFASLPSVGKTHGG